MSEAKHTPGPWEWVPVLKGQNSLGYAALYSVPGKRDVLTPCAEYHPRSPAAWISGDMTDADRDLIAAAPELLAFVEEIVESLQGLSYEQEALDLIAKVKGEAK